MFNAIRFKIYYLLTCYFQIWARIVLFRWKPIIIAIVGSAGKTSTMMMIEQVLTNHISIKTSHKTNAASAIPLNILGLSQQSFSLFEWLSLVFLAPIASIKKRSEKIYLCELDTDRDGEMALHTRLIKPDICCWVSATPAHTENFIGLSENIIYQKMLNDQNQSILNTKSVVICNGDDSEITKKIDKVNVKHINIFLNSKNNDQMISIKSHNLSFNGTNITFKINSASLTKLIEKHIDINEINIHNPNELISKVNLYGMSMAILIGLSFGIKPKDIENSLNYFRLPPGRMSLFAGKHATTIIDSSYNASKEATMDAINVLKTIGTNGTLAILGDLRELGKLAKKEHEALGNFIITRDIDRIVLIGPQMKNYVLPILIANKFIVNKTVFALTPKEAKNLISHPTFIKSGETILIKGSQNTLFLEELVASLLVSEKDNGRLCRRGSLWENLRSNIY